MLIKLKIKDLDKNKLKLNKGTIEAIQEFFAVIANQKSIKKKEILGDAVNDDTESNTNV